MALAPLLFLLVASSVAADEFDPLREEFLASINAERGREGVRALEPSPALNRLAQELADELGGTPKAFATALRRARDKLAASQRPAA